MDDYHLMEFHTSDEWIVQRTGIRERRITTETEFTSHLCIRAVENLLESYGGSLEDVDLILVATHTPDVPFPSVASLIQKHFDVRHTGALDVNATCAGFTYALHMANSLITAGLHNKILVIGADTLSKITDYTDRTTCILFDDGAGAFLAHHLGSDGKGGIHLYRARLADQLDGYPLAGEGNLVQNCREVYRFAVSTVPKGVNTLLEQAELEAKDIDWFIPHSANLRIIEVLEERTGIPVEHTLYNLEYFGNTSAASIPLALHIGIKEGKVKKGDRILLYGFGGGYVHGGIIFTW